MSAEDPVVIVGSARTPLGRFRGVAALCSAAIVIERT
jgi:hypothetical protein